MLTRNGYKVKKDDTYEALKKKLTVKPAIPPVFVKPQYVKSYKIYHETAQFIYVPKHFGVQTFGPAKESYKGVVHDDGRWTFCGTLRPIQHEIAQTYLEKGDGMVCLQTGGGKTVLGLFIASQLKTKTLIVVHNTFLRDQWTERIAQFIPSVRVGVLQGTRTDTEFDIVIAMLQSISKKEYPPATFGGFGLTIVDECHHIASEVFVQAFQKITSPRMMGLSATPERKDGLMYVIEWFLGPIVYKSPQSDSADTKVRVEVFTHAPDDPSFSDIIYNAQGVMSSVEMVTKLVKYPSRTKLLATILEDIDLDVRQILVLSDRVQHCADIYEALSPDVRAKACILSQKTKLADRNEWCLQKRILIATYSMCKEGFDVPTLNTLMMATPRPDIDQVVGRILRVEKNARTLHPLILDIVDVAFRKQFEKRTKLYRARQYTIEDVVMPE